ncbi:Uncharacterised protein [Paenibacillus macerans]|nr:hypothetical protein PbDSM24746_04420 [Paenibacillus macerans]GBK66737.1 hypothetical protein PbJCM17693_04450 [Paenibacillus macerans]GIP08985.1 hypothetical protein J1TS5_11550 [Paenibacillus macerans]SUA84638.1 Uncharacterised protein [Paenibacillus macerans]
MGRFAANSIGYFQGEFKIPFELRPSIGFFQCEVNGDEWAALYFLGQAGVACKIRRPC